MRVIVHPEFKDIKIIENFVSKDKRGSFIKIYNERFFYEVGIDMKNREQFYSISNVNVIRGMHFQNPPKAHDKLVHVMQGRILDVIMDLRRNSNNYKKCINLELSAEVPCAVYIPQGFAHGFKCLEDNTIILYNVSEEYDKSVDMGIRWDTIGFDWSIEEPIVSDRDKSFVSLEEFKSYF